MITGTRYRLTLEINRQMQLARDIDRAMTEISTTKRILAPSDDPVGAARVSDIARMQADMAAWKGNLEAAAAMSTRADDALGATASLITRVKELMVGASTGTMSNENRETIALELRSIAEQIGALQNSRDPRGEPLFPTGEPLRIPVSDGIRIQAVASRAATFQVTTAAGLKDLAVLVSDAADAIVEPDPATRSAAVTASLAEVEAAANHVFTAQGEQGTRGNRIDNLLERLAQNNLHAEEERGAIEGADIMEVVARLQSRQLTLQAAQAAFTRINSGTLFDLLR